MTDHGNVVPLAKSLPTFAAVPRNGERPSEDWLKTRILGLLSIYYQPEDDPDMVSLALAMWVDALADLPREAIDRAVRTRVQSSSRQRPVPGEIRQLALACLEEPARAKGPSPFLPPPELDADEKARIEAAFRALRDRAGHDAALKALNAHPLHRIIETCAEVCGCTPAEIKGSRGSRAIIMARFLVCLLAFEHRGMSGAEVGRALGGRDHSVILRGAGVAREKLECEPAWIDARAEIERRLAHEGD